MVCAAFRGLSRPILVKLLFRQLLAVGGLLFYLVLFLLLASGAYIEWTLNGFEIVSPVSLMLLGLALADVLAMIGCGSWNSYELSFQVFLIIAMGSAALLLGSLFAHHMRVPFMGARSKQLGLLVRTDSVSIWKYVVLMLLVLVAIVLRVIETYKLAASLGVDTSSYSAAAKAVRTATTSIFSVSGMKFGSGYSFITKQLMKVVSCISYLAAYLFASEIIDHRRRGVIFSVALVTECWIYVFISGGRGDVLYQIIAFAVMLFILLVRRGRPSKQLSKRYFVIGGLLGGLLAVGFWASGALVGRKTNSNFIEYISFYFGGGIPSLQSILEAGSLADLTPGVRSFYYIFSIPYKFGLIPEYPIYSIDWIKIGSYTSNIFTGFARYYLDFGWLGLIILSFVASFLITTVYRGAKVSSGCFVLVLTGYFSAYAFDFAREEFIFSRFLSMTSIVWLLSLVVLVLFTTTDLRELVNYIAGRIKKKQV